MDVGDLVRVKNAVNNPVGIITKIDRTTPAKGYKKRYWVKIPSLRSPAPFMESRLELISKSS